MLLAVSLTPALAAAQSGVGVGAEFGYTTADFVGTVNARVENRTGAVGSVFIEFRLGRAATLTLGPSLGAKGGTTPLGGIPNARGVVDLVTIDLPILLRTRLPIGPVGILLEAGGAPGVRIGCNVEIQQATVPVYRVPCSDPALAASTFALWDLAAVGGIGLGIPIAGSEVGLKFRYGRGFVPVIESRDVYNRSLSFLLALPF